MTKTRINEWLIESTRLLTQTSEFASIEARVVLAFVLDQSREWLVTHPEAELDEAQLLQAEQLLTRIQQGEPLPYLVGKQSFYGLDFCVTPDVLIPRPETELLIEECITWLEEHPNRRSMADVGTGSGAIAITLADRFEDLHVSAFDVSEKALDVAKKNASMLKVETQIDFIQNDLLANWQARFDLIAANLPYIPSEKLKSLAVLKYEPELALDGGADGLDLINRLLTQTRDHLKPGGMIILEIEEGQADRGKEMVQTLLQGAEISILNDLANHPRILKIMV